MDIKEIQKRQKEHDDKYWEHNASDLEKIRHVTLHLGKVLGKFSAYCESKEHNDKHSLEKIQNEAVPDLIIHALRLSNFLNKDIEDLYMKRTENVVKMLEERKLKETK